MKRIVLTGGILGAVLVLAACGQESETTMVEAPAAPAADTPAAPTGDMAGMNMAGSQVAKTAKGTGTVKSVDAGAGAITVDHGPIPEAGWPAMTMAFKAAPDLVQSVKPGDKVAFDLTLKDGSGEITEITAITKQ
ncbi:MAG: copper-binding protein [Parvibaculum sp.]|uniref:copper-binding protein n=1 Tax=Parvibaculum sp. TaxID=2024848 RepID=UPI00273194D9|nr:copper-binding protein [Parvibaculum sp.]MDP2149771.1 copper-binding protein [Parvibaculum sp.]